MKHGVITSTGAPAELRAAFRVDPVEYRTMRDEARRQGLSFAAWLRALARAEVRGTDIDDELEAAREAARGNS